jgi:alpha-glucosidase (family GH31 glycosyl hydrolase)
MSKNDQTNVHGQFLLNSNAMDVDLQPLPALTYTTIGGIIDLYIFTGPTVQNVIEQYWAVIGVRDEVMTLFSIDCFRNLCCHPFGHLDFIFVDMDIKALKI